MCSIEYRLYWKASCSIKRYKHHSHKENKQTTKLQDWLDEHGQGIPPEIIRGRFK